MNNLPRNRLQTPLLNIRVQLLRIKIPESPRLLRRVIPTNPPRHEILISDKLAASGHLIRVLVDDSLDFGRRDLEKEEMKAMPARAKDQSYQASHQSNLEVC